MLFTTGVAQNCSLLKFDAWPDSLNRNKKDTVVCQGSCIDLYGKLPVLKQTNAYSISSISFLNSLPCEGAGTIPNGFAAPDNKISPTIDMGFNFCFFGKSYAKCVISDNGFLTFDTTRAGASCNYNLTTYPAIPNATYIEYMNSVMACCMDLFVPLNGSITTQTVGAAPFRVFIVKYNHCAYGGGSCPYPPQELDMKIALYETSNIIEVYIKKKTLCSTWNGGLAIQGIQNDAGNLGFATNGRNNTQWTAVDDAKRFTPSGADKTININWYNGASFIGSGVQHMVCPPASGWYRAECSIDNYCNNSSSYVTVKDSVYITVKAQSSTINTRTLTDSVKCYDNYVLLDAGDSGIAYRWNNGIKTRYLKVTRTGNYQCVKITDTLNCYFDSLRFNVHSDKVFLDSIRTYGCFAQGMGMIDIYGSGGTGAMQFKVGNFAYSNSNSFDSLAYGSYHIKLKDSLGCEIDTLVNIPRPTITIVLRNTCGYDSIGTILLKVKNFNGPYTYKLDTGGFTTDTFFLNVKGGSHTISIKNASGCIYDSVLYAPFTSLKLNASYSVVKASGCTGGNPDGSITITTTGGNPPYRYSSNYSSYKSSNVFNGLSEGGYLISVRDTFNCGIDSVIQVGALAHLYVNGYVINASCFNTNTASIVINGLGGVLPYSFSFGGAPFSSNNSRTNLGAGTMTVSIKDGRGCIIDTVLPIGQPPPLQFNPSISHVTCYSGNNGQITINGLGGIPPFTYSKNGGAFTTNNVFSNLVSGTYSFKIKDYNTCTKDTTIIITQPFPLNFQMGRTNTSCYNSSDGKVLFTPFGGTAPYEFSFNSGTFATKLLYDSLAKGSYTVRIRDAKGCTRDSVMIISNPPRITVVITIKNPSCFGSANARVKVAASGGTAPFQYNFNSSGFSISDSFLNLAAGNYSITVKDSKGCLFDTFTVINQPSPLVFNVALKHVSCFSDSNGQITVGAFGAILPYKFAIDNDTFSTTNVFPKRIIGSYYLRIKDANNCIYDTTVSISQPAVLKMNLLLNHVKCNQGNDGSINTTGSGGMPPYRYRVNGGSFTTSVYHPSLAAGNYNLTVADSNNCSFDTTVTITQPSRISSLLFITNTNCYSGSDGSFKVRASGGRGPYTYALDPSNYSSDSVFLNLRAGQYKVYILDANLCKFDTSFFILQPTKIITNSVVKNITCFNGNDGSIIISPGGGTSPYTCSRDSISFNSVFSFNNLTAGNYKFYIRDSRQCSYDTMITVYQSTFMTNSLIVKNVSCFNSNDAIVKVITNGGSKPYKYSFNGGPFDTISVFNNLSVGTYNIQTKDTFNCIKDSTVTISQPPQIFVKALSANSLCYNSHNGTINVTATGGTSPFLFSIDNILFSTTSLYYNLAPGIYTVSAKDKLGCIRDTIIKITEPDSFTFSPVVIHNTCYDGEDGVISFSVTGASPPYQYAFELNGYSMDTVHSGLKAGVYTIHIKDANNCQLIRKITVAQPPKPTLAPPEVVRVTWDNDSTVLLQWKNYPRALLYNVESKYLVKDIIRDTFYYQKLSQDQVYSYRVSVLDSCNFLSRKSPLYNTILLAGAIDHSKFINLYWNSYQNWQNGVSGYNIFRYDYVEKRFLRENSTTDTFYTYQVKPEDSVSEYIFFVEAIELNGNNANSVSNKVYLYTAPHLWVPNIFSPDNDGLNDYLIPKGSGIKSYTMSIYDRWGVLIYKGTENDKGWDGKFKGEDVPVGMYIYEVTANCYSGRNVEKTISTNGAVMVVR